MVVRGSQLFVMLLLFPVQAGADGFLSRGEPCKSGCENLPPSPWIYVNWTQEESLCDAVPIGQIEVTGRTDPVQYEFHGTKKLFAEVISGLKAAEKLSCGGEAARSLAAQAGADFIRLEQEVGPGLQAYDCAASDVSREERLEKVRAAIARIKASEPFLRNFLKRAKPIGIEAEKLQFAQEGADPCDAGIYPVWYERVIRNTHALSCRLHYAETSLSFNMKTGMNPVLAKTCEVVQEVKKVEPASEGIKAEDTNDSDITGI